MSQHEPTLPQSGKADCEPQTPAAGRRERRWYQFGLGTLLILVTLAAVVAAVWRGYLEPYWRQRATMALIEKLGGRYQTVKADAWLRRLLGHDLRNVTLVDLGDCGNPADYLEAVVDLPRLGMLAVGGPGFTDEHLVRLRRASRLRGLVLDGTGISEAGLAALRDAMPQVEIYISQRRAIAAIQGRAHVVTSPAPAHAALRQLVGDAYFEEARAVRGWPSDFSDADLTHLRVLTSLQMLVLRERQVSDAGLAQVKGLTRLQRLNLVGTQVSGTGLAHLEELASLQRLDLACTRVGDAGLLHLKGLARLQCLDLSGTRVSDAGLAHLKGLTRLRMLILYHTQVSDAGAADLAEALPKCNVYR